MEMFRYLVALVQVVTLPSVLFLWLFIHPWIGFWRQRGVVFTVVFFSIVKFSVIVALWSQRAELLAVDFGWQPVLTALGLLGLFVAFRLAAARGQQLTPRMLAGIPELQATDGNPGPLLTEGVYARIRHPRYVEIVLLAISWALIANYLAAYVVAMMAVVAVLLTVPLEERELVQRFGPRYLAYCSAVPRYLPRKLMATTTLTKKET